MYSSRGNQQTHNNTGPRFSDNRAGGQGRGQGGISSSIHARQSSVASSQNPQAQAQAQTQVQQMQQAQDQQKAKAFALSQMIRRHNAKSDALKAEKTRIYRELENLKSTLQKTNEAFKNVGQQIPLAKRNYEEAPKGTETKDLLKKHYQSLLEKHKSLEIVMHGAAITVTKVQKECDEMPVRHERELYKMRSEMATMVQGEPDLQKILDGRTAHP